MIGFEWLLTITVFCFTAAFTPGPNNVMLTASGANFGFRRTVPHMLGITLGFSLMNLVIGLGLGGVFETYPQIHIGLKYVSIAYLLYLAWKIAQAGEAKNADQNAKPFTFLQAAAFQWVNPKAWVIAVGAISTFTTVGGDLLMEVVILSLVYIVVTVPSVSTWTFFGTVIARYLHKPEHLRLFNWGMAGLLVLSLVPAMV